MGVGDTNTLPSKTYPQVRGSFARGFPAPLPGGIEGPAALPSREESGVGAAGIHSFNRFVPGGEHGPIILYRPSVNGPYNIGNNQGNVGILRSGIDWLRGQFQNVAGLQSFQPQHTVMPSWTANANGQQPKPASAIPFSRKWINHGGLRREAFVDEQLFDILPRWVIQKPLPRTVSRSRKQPRISQPYQPRLTRWSAAASFGQTTQTLISSQAMQNILKTVPTSTPGGTYGGY
jgi:hypothetical protein